METATLRLRGAHDPAEGRRRQRRGPAIRWAEDVVDNEGLGRKSSKGVSFYDQALLSRWLFGLRDGWSGAQELMLIY